MKRILILLFFVSSLTFGQSDESYKENINKDFIDYNELILRQEFEKSMDYMLPEFFEIIPKNQMVMLMQQIYNNPDLEFKMDKPKDIVYGEPRKIEEKYYSEITYSYNINMKFKSIEEGEDEKQQELTKTLTKLSLEKTFGSGNVKYDDETEFFEIHLIKNAFGISKNGKSDWKFVVVEPKQKFILEKILPKELTEKL